MNVPFVVAPATRPGEFTPEREDDEREDGWECPRCTRQVKRDGRGRVCPYCGWYEG